MSNIPFKAQSIEPIVQRMQEMSRRIDELTRITNRINLVITDQ